MAGENPTNCETLIKNVRIQTSVDMWRAFEVWWRSRGKISLAEGLRSAMEEVSRNGQPRQV